MKKVLYFFSVLFVISVSIIFCHQNFTPNFAKQYKDISSVIFSKSLEQDVSLIRTSYRWSVPNNLITYPLFGSTKKNKSIPQMDLTIDNDLLFSNDKGILALGNRPFDNQRFGMNLYHRPGNFNRLPTSKFKVDASFKIHGNSKSIFEARQCKVGLGGAASRTYAKKPFKIYFKKKINLSIGGKTFESSRFYLRAGGNEWNKSLITDAVIQNGAIDYGIFAQKNSWLNLFLNSNYWGVYNFRQRVFKGFLQENLPKGEQYESTIKYERLDKGSQKGLDYFYAFRDRLGGDSDSTLFEFIDKHIDANKFLTYIAVELLTANADCPGNNEEILVSVDTNKNYKLYWILKDLDQAFKEKQVETYQRLVLANTISGKLFNNMMAYNIYREKFISILTNQFFEDFKKLLEQECQRQMNKLRPHLYFQSNRWRYSSENQHIECMNKLYEDIQNISSLELVNNIVETNKVK